ncbi:UrcA family protein [Sphingopyxis sp. LARHCG72]
MAKLSLLLAAPVALVGFAVPAAAEGDGERRSVVVRYDDLNLSSVQGRERLNTRIKFAVQTVCGSRAHYRQTLSQQASARQCEDSAMADADVKLAGLISGDGTRLAERGRIVINAAP